MFRLEATGAVIRKAGVSELKEWAKRQGIAVPAEGVTDG